MKKIALLLSLLSSVAIAQTPAVLNMLEKEGNSAVYSVVGGENWIAPEIVVNIQPMISVRDALNTNCPGFVTSTEPDFILVIEAGNVPKGGYLGFIAPLLTDKREKLMIPIIKGDNYFACARSAGQNIILNHEPGRYPVWLAVESPSEEEDSGRVLIYQSKNVPRR